MTGECEGCARLRHKVTDLELAVEALRNEVSRQGAAGDQLDGRLAEAVRKIWSELSHLAVRR